MSKTLTLDEALEELVRYIERGEKNGRPLHFIGDYKQAILQWVADEVVGKAPTPSDNNPREQLRYEQRQILKAHGWKEMKKNESENIQNT